MLLTADVRPERAPTTTSSPTGPPTCGSGSTRSARTSPRSPTSTTRPASRPWPPSRAPQFHAILAAFDQLTGCPVLVNTSFNVRGEPIVCTPEDAYRCFMRTEIDMLVLEDCLLEKGAQPDWDGDDDWQVDFILD